jgi:hypothetical protein
MSVNRPTNVPPTPQVLRGAGLFRAILGAYQELLLCAPADIVNDPQGRFYSPVLCVQRLDRARVRFAAGSETPEDNCIAATLLRLQTPIASLARTIAEGVYLHQQPPEPPPPTRRMRMINGVRQMMDDPIEHDSQLRAETLRILHNLATPFAGGADDWRMLGGKSPETQRRREAFVIYIASQLASTPRIVALLASYPPSPAPASASGNAEYDLLNAELLLLIGAQYAVLQRLKTARDAAE